MIQQVMERIVTQTIPQVVINNPEVDWNPYTNEVKPAAVKDSDAAHYQPPPITNAPEPDTRYATLLKDFNASRKADPYSPTAPTLIDRRFQEDREIPEAHVKAMLEQVLSSPLVPQTRAVDSSPARPPASSHSISGTTVFAPAANTPKPNWTRSSRKNIRLPRLIRKTSPTC